MTHDLIQLGRDGVVVLSTYLLHSTLLLGAAWLLLALFRPASWTLRELVWRWFAVLPFATVAIQFAFVDHGPLTAWTFSDVEPELQRDREPTLTAARSAESVEASSDDISRATTLDGSNAAVVNATPTILPSGESSVGGASRSQHATPDLLAKKSVTFSPRPEPVFPRLTDGGIEKTPKPENVVERPTASRFVDPPVPSKADGTTDSKLNRAESPPVKTSTTAIASTPAGVDVDSASLSLTGLTRVGLGVFLGACCWIVIGIATLITACAKHRRWSRTAVELTDGKAYRAVQLLRQKHAIRRPIRLLAGDGTTDPAAFGVWRWTIVLPVGLEDRLGNDQLRAVLAHEVAHLVRGDTRWLLIGGLLSRCLAWQPLNLIAVREWKRASECRCDDWAVRRGVTAISLAKSLTELAEWQLDSACPTVELTAVGNKSSLRLRVERLLADGQGQDVWDQRWTRPLIVAGFIVVAAVFVNAGPRTTWADADKSPQAEELVKKTAVIKPAVNTRVRSSHPDNTITAEIAALSEELDQAMSLLQEDDDPELQILVSQIRLRLQSIQNRAARVEHRPTATTQHSH